MPRPVNEIASNSSSGSQSPSNVWIAICPACVRRHHTRDHENGRPVQSVENDLRQPGMQREFHDFEAEGENCVSVDAAWFQTKVNPSKDQRESDGKCRKATPGREHVTKNHAPCPDYGCISDPEIGQ